MHVMYKFPIDPSRLYYVFIHVKVAKQKLDRNSDDDSHGGDY